MGVILVPVTIMQGQKYWVGGRTLVGVVLTPVTTTQGQKYWGGGWAIAPLAPLPAGCYAGSYTYEYGCMAGAKISRTHCMRWLLRIVLSQIVIGLK